MSKWDERYADAPGRLFGDRPNEYVREVMARSDMQPKSALMIGADARALSRLRLYRFSI